MSFCKTITTAKKSSITYFYVRSISLFRRENPNSGTFDEHYQNYNYEKNHPLNFYNNLCLWNFIVPRALFIACFIARNTSDKSVFMV